MPPTLEQLEHSNKRFIELFMYHQVLRFYIDKIVRQIEVNGEIDPKDLIKIITLVRELHQAQDELKIYIITCSMANNLLKLDQGLSVSNVQQF